MAQYLTETAYQRWYRQYQINIRYYFDSLDNLRIRLNTLHQSSKTAEIEFLLDEIDENLEKALPRNFSTLGNPLMGFEKFLENLKVLINLLSRMKGKGDRYFGIYQNEKDKALNVHQQFKFKDKLKQAREKLESLEAEMHAEFATEVDQPSMVAKG